MRICAVLLLMVAGAEAAKVTPMEKVIGLLKGLSTKVAADGAKEAAAYDKYSCFCKEQADEKLYSIEKSDDKLASLKAQIQELETAISELNAQVSQLSKKISGLEGEIDQKTKKRANQRAAYEVKAKDMNEAIGACGAAIDALKGSKDDMTGAKLNLAQVATEKVLGAAAPKFEYQSNDIIATLESLLATFKSMKKDLDFEESDVNSAFESTRLGLQNEKKFAEKERDEKEAVVESKTEEMETAKNDRDEEQKDRDADQSFMDELTKDCESKAQTFDQRSSTRADELSTLNEATAELEKGAVPNFGANKNLVDLQKKPAVVKKSAVAPVAVSFLQTINKHEESRKVAALAKVLEFLQGAAGKSGSIALTNAAMRVKMSEDHFVKVRALINDLIAKLKADALSEASQKSTCDKGMKKAISDRDEANAKIEVANAKITSFTAKKEELKSQISQLESDIADLSKALLEATELRNDDKADHSKTVGMSEEAIDSVKLALGLLQDFYKKAFVQTSKYTPPKADRSGNTVGDLAPAVADEAYHGSQSESKGIVGILEVILSDFERTKKQTESDEKDSKAAFDELEKDTKADIKAKETSIGKKDGELADTRSDIIDQQQALSDAQELFDSSKRSLESLEAMCVAGEETWEERKKKREDEIEALKNAMEILNNWQAS